jgi:hypothetical protein
MPEKGEISIHEARLYRVFTAAPTSWLTNREVAEAAKIAERTARLHTLRLVQLGILDLAEVFPAHKFRLAQQADKRNRGYLTRLENVCEVFGLTK